MSTFNSKKVAKRIAPGHYCCEDSWYSCPLATDGCADERQGNTCNCGRDERVKEIQVELEKAYEYGWEDGFSKGTSLFPNEENK